MPDRGNRKPTPASEDNKPARETDEPAADAPTPPAPPPATDRWLKSNELETLRGRLKKRFH